MAYRETSITAADGRLDGLDVLRGLAVLGLLFAHFPSTGGSAFETDYPPILGWTLSDRSIWLANSVLVDGAMRGLFATLFGVSLWIMTGPRPGRDALPANCAYIARSAGLVMLGAVHIIIFAWAPDILHVYGLAAPAALLLSRLDPRLLLAGGMTGFAILAAHAAFADNSTLSVDASLLAQEAAIKSGGYADQVVRSVQTWLSWSLSTSLIWHCLEAGSYMLIGIAALRLGFFTRLPVRRGLALTALGYGIGIPACTALAIDIAASDFPQIAMFHPVTVLAKPFVVLGHAALIGVLMQIRAPRRVLMAVLAPVGRLALTHYMSGSAIMLVLFTGAGAGLDGVFSRTELAGLAVLVGAGQVVFARIWLARFRHGPMEKLLRLWTQAGGRMLGNLLSGRAAPNASRA